MTPPERAAKAGAELAEAFVKTLQEQGAREERRRAAGIIRQLLDVHRLSFEAFGQAIMDPDLTREAMAYVAEAEEAE